MQASSIAELLNSKSTLFDSPGALMNAEFQAYPYTPLASTITAAGSSPSPGLQSTLQTAQKHREQANATLEDVSKLFQAVSMDKLADLEAPFARVSPGHFLLHQAGSGRALGSPIPTSSVHHAQSPGQRLLQVALSSGYKARSKASTPASRFSVVSPAAGGTSPHSRLSFSPGVQATPSMQPSPASGCANGTSRKLLNLQKRHAQLLEDCQAAEKAATEASEHRRRADADVAAATTRLRELKSAIKLHEGQVAELVSEQQERTAQLEQMSELLGARQQQAAEAAAAMQAAREEAQHAQHALAEINARVEDARAEEAALRGRLGELRGCVDEAEAVHEMLSELQYQLGEATEQLNAIKEQRDVAEAAAVEAEARRAAAEADLGEVTGALTIHGQAATLAEGLSAEVEALLTEKEARAEAALQRWEGAEEGLARASTALVEVTARLEARRALVAEAERRLRVAESQAEDAAAWATEAERASKAAECEMEACKARLAAAQAEEEAANERCIAALARAAAAEECARAKESLAEQLTQEEHALRGRCADAEALERRVLQLKAEVGEGEAAAALKAQLQMVSAECDRLREELAQAHQASADDFELNRCMDEEVARLKEQAMAAVAQSSALSGALEAERRGRVAAEEEAQRAQQAMHAALAEVDRLTHHHHSIAEVKRLQSDLSDAKNKMEAAQEAAQQAERHVASADAQIALALEEKEAALDRVEAVTAARDASIEEMAQLRCEVAHQSALTQEMRDHVAELNRVMKSLKRERKEAQTLAAALQLQVDSLQERLKAEMGRRAVARAAEALRDRSEGRGAGGKEELERQAAQLLAQNAALKATAAKLSHSLAAVMRHAGEAEGADADLIGALHA